MRITIGAARANWTGRMNETFLAVYSVIKYITMMSMHHIKRDNMLVKKESHLYFFRATIYINHKKYLVRCPRKPILKHVLISFNENRYNERYREIVLRAIK